MHRSAAYVPGLRLGSRPGEVHDAAHGDGILLAVFTKVRRCLKTARDAGMQIGLRRRPGWEAQACEMRYQRQRRGLGLASDPAEWNIVGALALRNGANASACLCAPSQTPCRQRRPGIRIRAWLDGVVRIMCDQASRGLGEPPALRECALGEAVWRSGVEGESAGQDSQD
ncbi:hypothetical protein PSPO01_07401 [Paraphaeosphaeria sporulosa]